MRVKGKVARLRPGVPKTPDVSVPLLIVPVTVALDACDCACAAWGKVRAVAASIMADSKAFCPVRFTVLTKDFPAAFIAARMLLLSFAGAA